MNEKNDGPCRKVSRSRKRSFTSNCPGDDLIRDTKAFKMENEMSGTCYGHPEHSKTSDLCNIDAGHQKKEIQIHDHSESSQKHSIPSARSKSNLLTCKSDSMKIISDGGHINHKNERWFSNSFVTNTCKSVDDNSVGTMASDSSVNKENCHNGRVSSGHKTTRLDVDFSQKSQTFRMSDVGKDGVKTEGTHAYESHHFHEEREKSPVILTNGSKTGVLDQGEGSHSPNIFHSTPVKYSGKSKGGSWCCHGNDKKVMSGLPGNIDTEDILNNSDQLLASLPVPDADGRGHPVCKGDNSTFNANRHSPKMGFSKNASNHVSEKNCVVSESRTLSDKNVMCEEDVLNNLHESSATSFSTKSKIETQEGKHGMSEKGISQNQGVNVSYDDIFEHESDFLCQIESLERQTNGQVVEDNRHIAERTRNKEVRLVDSEQPDIQGKTAMGCEGNIEKLESITKPQIIDKPFDRTEIVAKSVDLQVVGTSMQAYSPMVNTSNGNRTPNSISVGGSLKDRIKQRLQENATAKVVNSPGLVMELRREGLINMATTEAEQLKRDRMDMDIGPFYGLSSKVKVLLEQHRGITKLYDWQDECLRLPAVVEGKNLIYSLPTSGGKTLVAEILIMRELLCKKRDAILILPFVSIVQEKVRGLAPFGIDLDFLVEEYAGSKGKFPPLKRRKRSSLYIATIEKAHSLINSLIEHNRMESLGLVVVDELHMIGEGGSRGATLESTLLKIIYTQKNTQIVGMSATLSNISDLQTFLTAEVYSNNFRPVELTEYTKLNDSIYKVNTVAKCPDDQLTHERVVMFKYTPEMVRMDGDHLLGLVLEVIPEKSCLLFCPTKKNCENVAMMLCKMMVKHHHELSSVKKAERKLLLKELYNDGAGKICPVLQYTVHFGVAYHHSGLTTDERRLIEDAYSDGILCLLTCTSTLAAGVNLPAKRVILRSPYVGSQFISRSQYKQMVGRAGRAGIDTSGESILITKLSDRKKVGELLTAPLEVCHSSLMHDDGKGLRSLILSAVGLQITPTTRDVFACMEKTLLSVQANQNGSCDVKEITRKSLQDLIDLGLIVQKRSLSQESEEDVHLLEVTMLGRATFKGSVSLDWSGKLYKDLRQGEESLVLSSHLHLLYLVTPYDMVDNVKPSWITYFQELNTLNPVELKMAALIGVPEGYIAKKASGQNSRQKVDDFVVSRFYLTLMLYGLWKQKSVWEVAEKFQQPRGFIQNMLSSAASFASCVLHFCQELDEFWPYQDLFGNFVKRLAYCVTAELVPLMEIPGVKLGRAKQLYGVGYKSLPLVANADPEDIVRKIKQIPRKVARQIVTAAKMLLNEKAEALWQEVEDLVMVPGTVSTHPSPDLLSSQGSMVSSGILRSLVDWDDDI